MIAPEGRTDSSFRGAARVSWTLKSTGFTDLPILNSGTQARAASGLPAETAPVMRAPAELDLTL